VERRGVLGGVAEAEFDDSFRELFTLAHRVARRILQDRDGAEEVAAEAMSRTYAHWRRVRSLPYRDAWVAKVATNLALNVVRRRPPRPDAATTHSYEDRVADQLDVATALRALPGRQREVLVLRHLCGLSEPEVAERLGLGLGTVKTHLRRGHDAMRVQLDPTVLERAADG
jgi:RNA polymerase sigma-70 factor (ECF subfamily)